MDNILLCLDLKSGLHALQIPVITNKLAECEQIWFHYRLKKIEVNYSFGETVAIGSLTPSRPYMDVVLLGRIRWPSVLVGRLAWTRFCFGFGFVVLVFTSRSFKPFSITIILPKKKGWSIIVSIPTLPHYLRSN